MVWDIYTSYESCLISSYLIQKYFVILIFVVGKCVAFSDNLSGGDVAISSRVLIGDVDQIKETNARLGQIPHFPRAFECENDIITYFHNSIEKRSFAKHELCTFISSNAIMNTTEKVKDISMGGMVLGYDHNVVFDCTSGGVAIAAYLSKVPILVVKVVEVNLDEKFSAETYVRVLKHYSDVGKSIVTCIGDIGRNDVIRGE